MRSKVSAPALHGLRGLAACMVVASHVSNSTGLWGGVLGKGGGQVGVMIFFALSGYLIGFLYLDQPFTIVTVRHYVVRRAARVLPLFYYVVTLAVLLNFVQEYTGYRVAIYPISLDQAFWHYGMVFGVSILWTIPVEIHFYIIFLMVWWLKSKSALLAMTVCLFVIILYWALPVRVPEYVRVFPYYAVFFLAGLLMSRLVDMRTPATERSAWMLFLAPLALLPFLLYPNVYSQVVSPSGWLERSELQQMWHDPRYTIAAIAILAAAIASRPVTALLSVPPMVFLGEISYSIYLLHYPVIDLLMAYTSLLQFPLLFLSATFIITTATAAVAFYLLEKPSNRYFTRLFMGGKPVTRPT